MEPQDSDLSDGEKVFMRVMLCFLLVSPCLICLPRPVERLLLSPFKLLVEIVHELYFHSYYFMHGFLHRDQCSDETPLLEAGIQQPIPISAGYQAVDIAAVDEVSLDNYGAPVDLLPKRWIQLPVDEPSHVAVLSWRWDLNRYKKNVISQNVACALRYCKKNGIRYLFIDRISINQSHPPETLIPAIANFTTLYATIPVIAAYDNCLDKPNNKRRTMQATMFRPWIFVEVDMMRRNPHKIAYVGYGSQGTWIHRSPLRFCGYLPSSQIKKTEFVRQLRVNWSGGYRPLARRICDGTLRITKIHDFKYVIPSFVEVFTAAQSLSRNDYLLTVALMILGSGEGIVDDISSIFLDLPYERYSFSSSRSQETGFEVWSEDEDGEQHGCEYEYWVETVKIYCGLNALATMKFEYVVGSRRHTGSFRGRSRLKQRIFDLVGIDPQADSASTIPRHPGGHQLTQQSLPSKYNIDVTEMR